MYCIGIHFNEVFKEQVWKKSNLKEYLDNLDLCIEIDYVIR